MNVNYTARHTHITPEIKTQCERRLISLEKLLDYAVDADIILSVEKYRHKAEINVRIKGSTLNTVQETQDMFSSLSLAFDHIEKRVKKERDKLKERKRRKQRGLTSFAPPVIAEEPRTRVIRSMDYSLKPMSVEEALLQLESSNREVFVFRKSDSETWAVIYKRKDGNFGLIDPD